MSRQKGDIMREVMISIKPRWVELIASGKKTIEVRRTRPKCETPFKCYIYCTKGDNLNYLRVSSLKPKFWIDNKAYGSNVARANGKVIGEFVCDKIDKIFQCNSGWVQEHACISREEYFKYLGLPYNSHFDSKGAYAWHISDLVIYDNPRELSEFETYHCSYVMSENGYPIPSHHIKTPPQSWFYVKAKEPRQTAD